MKTLLIIFLLVNGQWVAGETIDGWHPAPQPDLETCQERAAFINNGPNSDVLYATCSEGTITGE